MYFSFIPFHFDPQLFEARSFSSSRGKKEENLRFRERKLEEVAVIITRKGEIETKLWKIFNDWPVRA